MDCIDENLHGVAVRENMDELKRVPNDAHGHELLAVVATTPHHAAYQALHNGAGGLSKALALVSPGSVGNVGGELVLHGDKVLK